MIQQDTTNTDSSWVKHIRCTGTKWSPGESVDCGCDRSVCYLGPIGGSVLLANVARPGLYKKLTVSYSRLLGDSTYTQRKI